MSSPRLRMVTLTNKLMVVLNRGKVNNLFDNKILYLVALAIFEIGSAIVGSAPIPEAVILGRVVAGIGGSGIYVSTINTISAITTPTERTAYLNFVGIA